MKKTLNFSDDANFYYVSEANNNSFKISKETMQIDGKTLYEKFFKDLDTTEELQIEIIKTDSEEKEFNLVYNRINDNFISIVDKINIEFGHKNQE